jgi:hypothetical protein
MISPVSSSSTYSPMATSFAPSKALAVTLLALATLPKPTAADECTDWCNTIQNLWIRGFCYAGCGIKELAKR